MMKIITLPLGDYQTNCYLVGDENGNCAVIDPGYEAGTIFKTAEREGLSVRAILLTHGHFDHVGGVRELAQKADCPVYLHKNDLSLPFFLTAGELYYTDLYAEGDRVQVGALEFKVLETPGHTEGSVCLGCENALFTGDTLFAGSCGRTDLGGSWKALEESLRRLSQLPGDAQVYPGHGPATTLETERNTNPFMK